MRENFPTLSCVLAVEVVWVALTLGASLTSRTRKIEPHGRTLELPLLVKSSSFFFLFCLKPGLRGPVFAVRSPPYPREGISDVLARGPIVPVLEVVSPFRRFAVAI